MIYDENIRKTKNEEGVYRDGDKTEVRVSEQCRTRQPAELSGLLQEVLHV